MLVAQDEYMPFSISLTVKIELTLIGVEKRNSSSAVLKNVAILLTILLIMSMMKNMENMREKIL